MTNTLILIQCPDQVGLVAAIADIIAGRQLNIVVMREFVDHDSARFFTRIECSGGDSDPEILKKAFKGKLGQDAFVRVSPYPSDKKIAVLVTKEYHCLGDILVRNFFRVLGAEVCCVAGNHEVLAPFVRRFSIPFYHISREDKTRQTFERELLTVLEDHHPNYIFLAKFMRILSAEFISRYPGRIINIHHSFLPAFAGANPYRQAYERGVKVIGATAHVVTEQLDDGPIIVQETIPINHNHDMRQMKAAGSEIERSVLNRAMNLILEDRVFITGNKTVIFE